MKKLIFLILVAASLKAELLQMNLVQFANFISNENKINILIDDVLKDKSFYFFINKDTDSTIKAFTVALKSYDLQLVKTNDFYYIEPITKYIEPIKYRPIKLNFVNFDDISNFLNVYETSIKFEYIKTQKILLVKSNEKDFNSIKDIITTLDFIPKQKRLKITILDTNLDKINELGADYTNINLTNNTNFFLNLVSYPFNISNTLNNTQSKGFYSFIKFLNNNGSSKLISNPILTLTDEKTTIFDVVNNVPYLTGTTTINENNIKTTNQYNYKDIGTQIKINSKFLKDDFIYIDLEMNISNLLNNSENLTTTSKKYLKQSFILNPNELLILTGINQEETVNNNVAVPLLSDIPYLGNLFKYDYERKNKTNLTIIFELLN